MTTSSSVTPAISQLMREEIKSMPNMKYKLPKGVKLEILLVTNKVVKRILL